MVVSPGKVSSPALWLDTACPPLSLIFDWLDNLSCKANIMAFYDIGLGEITPGFDLWDARCNTLISRRTISCI